MKKTTLVIAAVVAGLSVLCYRVMGGPGERQPQMVKESVTKVLGSHGFTPPVVLPGPGGSSWYVGSRSLTPNSIEEAAVGHRGGTNFTVELTGYHRDKTVDPWTQMTKFSVPALEKAEAAIREQLQKELTSEERPAQSPKQEKEKAK